MKSVMLFITVLNIRVLQTVFIITNVVWCLLLCQNKPSCPIMNLELELSCESCATPALTMYSGYTWSSLYTMISRKVLFNFSLDSYTSALHSAYRYQIHGSIKTNAMTWSLHAYLRARNHSFPEGSFFATCKIKWMTIEPSCFLLSSQACLDLVAAHHCSWLGPTFHVQICSAMFSLETDSHSLLPRHVERQTRM